MAHNGSLIPIPGRDMMVQAWYQGGVSVFDWTDPTHPNEIAYFDRGPLDADEAGAGRITGRTYWYNGYIYGSEITRGLDVFELGPAAHLTQNEIDAAKSVKLDYFNTQGQVKFTWPASYSLARAYLDQLERSNGLDHSKIASARAELGVGGEVIRHHPECGAGKTGVTAGIRKHRGGGRRKGSAAGGDLEAAEISARSGGTIRTR